MKFLLCLLFVLSTCIFAQEQKITDLVYDAAEGYIDNCHVNIAVYSSDNGRYYHQLYVHNQFKGNFELDEVSQLDQRLRSYLEAGVCFREGEKRKVPRLVSMASRGRVDGCKVNLNVYDDIYSKFYDQLIVRGQFKGNFKVTKKNTLKKRIQEYIDSGICYVKSRRRR